ncbi:MAG: hypothetical protein B7X95_05285 [Methylophilaceae bacterium 17-44-8]|nr:MAG: hypothetical protein B7X95_05285 [Methylophilaceae bacterium 17-44-8]
MTIQVYVGTYAKYNNGSIKGAWLDLTDYSDYETFLEACSELHSDEIEPEFMFQDYEGFPKEFYSESSIDLRVFEYIDLDDNDREIVDAFLDCFGDCAGDLFEASQDAYIGEHDSDSDFAYEMVQSCYNLEEPLASYFDYDKFARDLMVDHLSSNNRYFHSSW